MSGEAYIDNAPAVFTIEFPKLDDRAKRLFSDTIQDLHLHCFVLREGLLRSNPHFLFIEKHEELVAAYLALGGWRLGLDRQRGIARLYHPEGSGRVHFNKEETLLLLTLRLLYHEQKQTVTDSTEITVSVGSLREKLLSLLGQSQARTFLSRKGLSMKLRKFERYHFISFEEHSLSKADEDTLITLAPSLEILISPQSLEETEKRLEALLQGAKGAAAEAPEGDPA